MFKISALVCITCGFFKGLLQRCSGREESEEGVEQGWKGQQQNDQQQQQQQVANSKRRFFGRCGTKSNKVTRQQEEQEDVDCLKENLDCDTKYAGDVLSGQGFRNKECLKEPLLSPPRDLITYCSDITTTDDSYEDFDPLAELKLASQLVKSGHLGQLCDKDYEAFDPSQQKPPPLDEYSPISQLAAQFTSPFITNQGEQSDNENDTDTDNDNDTDTDVNAGGDLSNIWESIAGANRTLTGTVLPSLSTRYNQLSKSLTFQPTYAKLAIDKVDMHVQNVRQIQTSSDLSMSDMASLLTVPNPLGGDRNEVGGDMGIAYNLVNKESYYSQLGVQEEEEDDIDEEIPCLQFVVIKGPCTGLDCILDPMEKSQFSVGRLADSSFCLGDPEISGMHLRIQVEDDGWYIVDTGSLNGTTLNGQLISVPNRGVSDPHKLNVGDRLELGTSTTIKVREHFDDLPVIQQQNATNVVLSGYQVDGNFIKLDNYLHQFGTLDNGAGMRQDVEEAREVEVIRNEKIQAHAAYATQQGRDHRDRGSLKEDFVRCDFPLNGFDSLGVAMLFDGHGGTQAAQQCKHSIPEILAQNVKKDQREFAKPFGYADILCETFLKVDDELGDEGSGCTATVLVFETKNGFINFQMANVGDSSGIMLNLTRQTFRELTHDHKVSDEQESLRLDKLQVTRTHGDTRILGLNLARTLGDKYVKAPGMGVIAEPHVSDLITVDAQDSVLVIMASDGLWDVLSFEDVAEIAGDQCLEGLELQQIVEYLVDKAVARGSRDDISVLAVLLGQPVALTTDDSEEQQEQLFLDCNNEDSLSSIDTFQSI